MPYDRDIEHGIICFANSFPPYSSSPLNSLSEFANGAVFARLLGTLDAIAFHPKDFEGETGRWVEKLTILKKLMQRMESYAAEQGKSIRTKDVELIEIAKHDSPEHILGFFELVVAVFMLSARKEDYIQTIMRLDEQSQQALVVVVQNAIHDRVADASEPGQGRALERAEELATENRLLREEVEEVANANDKLRRETGELRERVEELEEAEEKHRQSVLETGPEQLRGELEQLRTMNDNLKQKLLMTVREHEEELARMREENIFLQNKMLRFREYEEAVEQLREQLQEAHSDRERTS